MPQVKVESAGFVIFVKVSEFISIILSKTNRIIIKIKIVAKAKKIVNPFLHNNTIFYEKSIGFAKKVHSRYRKQQQQYFPRYNLKQFINGFD